MRFTFLNTKRAQPPSFEAKYGAYVMFMLALSQISAVAFGAFFLWHFMQTYDAVLLSAATVVFLAVSFYIAYMGAQQAQIIMLFCIVGIQLLALASMPQEFDFYSMKMNSDYFVAASVLGDLILVSIFYRLQSMYPPSLARRLNS